MYAEDHIQTKAVYMHPGWIDICNHIISKRKVEFEERFKPMAAVAKKYKQEEEDAAKAALPNPAMPTHG